MVFRDESGKAIIRPSTGTDTTTTKPTISTGVSQTIGRTSPGQAFIIQPTVKKKPTPKPTPIKIKEPIPFANLPSIYDSGLIDRSTPSGIPSSTWKLMQNGLGKKEDTTQVKVDIKPKDEFPDIKPSPYLEQFGYKPLDFDYSDIIHDIRKQKVSKEELTALALGTIKARSYASKMASNLRIIRTSPVDSRWVIGGKEYSKEEAIGLLETGIGQNIQASQAMRQLPSILAQNIKLGKQERMLQSYRAKGYEVDITPEGYQFKLPKAEDVHSWYVGDPKKEKTLLTFASFMESPLAIGTLMDIGAGAITGDEGYVKRRKEKIAKFSLGLQESIKGEDYIDYWKKVGTSPAMVQGVYLPAVTLGAGYAISGVSAGASGVTGATGSIFGRIGARGGLPLANVLKLGSGAVGAGLITAGGVGISRAVMEGGIDKYDLPSLAGEMGFSFGMAYGGFKTGSKMWTQKHTGSWKYDFKTNKMKWSPKDIKSQNILGRQNIVEQPFGEGGKKIFRGEGKQLIGGKKKVDVVTKGEQIPVKGAEGQMAYAKGTAKIISKTEPKFSIGKIKLGTVKEHIHFTRFKSLGELIGQKGKLSITKSVGESKPGVQPGMPGDKTITKGITVAKDTGDFKFRLGTSGKKPLYLEDIYINKPSTLFPGETVPTGIGLPKQSVFTHLGKYRSPVVSGKVVQTGRIFSFGKKPITDVGLGKTKTGMPGGGGIKGETPIIKLGLDATGKGSVMKLDAGSPSIDLGYSSGAEGLTSQGSKVGLSSLLKMGGDAGQASKMFDYGAVMSQVGAKAGQVFGGVLPIVTSGSPALIGAGGGSRPLLSLFKPQQTINIMGSRTDDMNIMQPVKPGGLSIVSALDTTGALSDDSKTITIGTVVGGDRGISGAGKGKQIVIPIQVGRQIYKPKKGRITAVGHDLISRGKQIQLGESLLKPLISPVSVQMSDLFQESEPVLAVSPVFESVQEQAQQQKQATALQLKMFSPALTVTEPIIQSTNIFTPKPIIPLLPGVRDKTQPVGKRLFGYVGKRRKGKRTLVKTVLADPFMVQLSQVKFGKATHLIPDKEVWKMGERTWWRIPTKELMEKGVNNKNTKISLNVFRR